MKEDGKAAAVAIGLFLAGLLTGVGVSSVLKRKTEVIEVTPEGVEVVTKRYVTWTTV